MKLIKICFVYFAILTAFGQEEYHFYSNQAPKKLENAVQLIKSEQKLFSKHDSLVSHVELTYHDVPSIHDILVSVALKSSKDSLLLQDTMLVTTKTNLFQQVTFQLKVPLIVQKGSLEVSSLNDKVMGKFSLKNTFNFALHTNLINLECLDPITREKVIVDQLTINDSLLFMSPSSKIYIDFYSKNDFKQSPPPMAKNYTKPVIPKPIKIVHNAKNNFSFKEEGLYVISADTMGAETNIILVTKLKFPRYTKAEELIKPLVYITTKEEYDKLSNSKTPKASLDSFWIELAGNTEYAKKLIKIFYDRVYYANDNYSQFTEGWKTDKGMIFIVFGKPDRILFDENGLEDWQYDRREETNYIFKKIVHPFDPQYSFLERNKSYDISWYPTIERWRKGLVE